VLPRLAARTRRHAAALRKAQNDENLKPLSSQIIEQHHPNHYPRIAQIAGVTPYFLHSSSSAQAT